ncbi:OLC1v1022230C1 [Oldenlandia corymbosa var. corymbosa]|uniref:OLC1v1022230C1 n=1 Tax=Oldenlandia corymbosa var. corymbosa TaxID=529605 RepID=A0AAV1C058_OLDCO|nr:OLC1v1022230C1 [Oldenlandia corymbosa var. corymbosa]
MASNPFSDNQNYYYSDYIHQLPAPIASSDSSSGSGGGSSCSASSPAGIYGGEVHDSLPPSTFSNNVMINLSSTGSSNSSMVLPFEYFSSGYSNIVGSSSTTSSSFPGTPAAALPDSYQGNRIWINSGEEYCSTGPFEYSSDFWQPPPEINEGGNTGGMAQRVEDNTTLKIACRYSPEERKDRIMRYLKKRNQRNFNKTIKYACRKTLADRRVRIRGRFAKNEVSDDDQTSSSFNQTSSDHVDHHLLINHLGDQEQLCHTNHDLSFLQMIPAPSEEEWLQEAIASLVNYSSVLPDGQ